MIKKALGISLSPACESVMPKSLIKPVKIDVGRDPGAGCWARQGDVDPEVECTGTASQTAEPNPVDPGDLFFMFESF